MEYKTRWIQQDTIPLYLISLGYPPNNIDWETWKLELDRIYRFHSNRRNIIALDMLNFVYTEWEYGFRTQTMLNIVNELNIVDFNMTTEDIIW